MAYDLSIKNGTVVDGRVRPAIRPILGWHRAGPPKLCHPEHHVDFKDRPLA